MPAIDGQEHEARRCDVGGNETGMCQHVGFEAVEEESKRRTGPPEELLRPEEHENSQQKGKRQHGGPAKEQQPIRIVQLVQKERRVKVLKVLISSFSPRSLGQSEVVHPKKRKCSQQFHERKTPGNQSVIARLE